jgi:hypothetical protein
LSITRSYTQRVIQPYFGVVIRLAYLGLLQRDMYLDDRGSYGGSVTWHFPDRSLSRWCLRFLPHCHSPLPQYSLNPLRPRSCLVRQFPQDLGIGLA